MQLSETARRSRASTECGNISMTHGRHAIDDRITPLVRVMPVAWHEEEALNMRWVSWAVLWRRDRSLPDALAGRGEAPPLPLAQPGSAGDSVLRREALRGTKAVMALTGGDMSEAARRLGHDRRSLPRKLNILT
ncbi:hypothetical protein ABENE_18885 [Asticcacaulis benevestitus DSM 16100 = ATCC BAA-896]|uniref:DNA binding HTH domain-containing protein n=1 Tax=Asticcacaulis benevestitus DSM 16100 = ATCC BAA-896 TaxID=1121022 RepID=V4PBJ8_9CAUL|nr:hypothetical protein ABENE_18885 [Asticcacaulis benevestitus DSM 16100 = ATCC BAA-896]